MTEEEIARIKEHIEIHARRERGAVIITEILRKAVAELEHIAELEAGRPKWHTPAEKLPKECTTVLAIDNLDSDSEPSTYYFVTSNTWEWLPRRIASLSNNQIKKWCEIPKE